MREVFCSFESIEQVIVSNKKGFEQQQKVEVPKIFETNESAEVLPKPTFLVSVAIFEKRNASSLENKNKCFSMWTCEKQEEVRV